MNVMKLKKRMVIAEDHKILREGLRALLSGEQGLEVIGEAEDGIDAIRCVETLGPDLVLMDLSMPKMNGISVIKEISRRFPEVKVLVLTVHASEDYLMEALRSGAHGYCLKDASHAELMVAIRTVLSGRLYLSPAVSEKVLAGYLGENGPVKADVLVGCDYRARKGDPEAGGGRLQEQRDRRLFVHQRQDRGETPKQSDAETGRAHGLGFDRLRH